MCIVIISLPIHDAINLKMNLSFLIKPFPHMNEKSGQKAKYFKNRKSF